MIISFSYHHKKLLNWTDPIMSWTSAPDWILINSLSQSFKVNTNVSSFGLTSLEALSIGLLIGKRVTLNNFTGKNERSGSYFKIGHFHVKQHWTAGRLHKRFESLRGYKSKDQKSLTMWETCMKTETKVQNLGTTWRQKSLKKRLTNEFLGCNLFAGPIAGHHNELSNCKDNASALLGWQRTCSTTIKTNQAMHRKDNGNC